MNIRTHRIAMVVPAALMALGIAACDRPSGATAEQRAEIAALEAETKAQEAKEAKEKAEAAKAEAEAEAEAARAEAKKPPKTVYVASKPKPDPVCNNCGTIINIETRKAKGEASGFGAVAGAVAGAVIGHQIGSGRGNDAATAAGAIGGGFAGHEIEKRAKSTTYYRVTVDMETGGTRTVDVGDLGGLSTGSKVKVVGNNLQVIG